MTTTVTDPGTATAPARMIGMHIFINSAAAAEEVLKWEFTGEQHARMDDLMTRNNNGELTPAEWNELEQWARLGTTLSTVQSRARKFLRNAAES